ncbi:hypothetical protein N7465_001232 [Penicillium sp. CMV-2018d]|nr:hypothetical protein N7465_001232 [Penicillium sp. CMV-2018d]
MILSTLLLLATQALADDYRPLFHFVPEKNRMNEPNGLIKIDSVWHLFYQHNPTANAWGNLNWGHATSTDLLQWSQMNRIELILRRGSRLPRELAVIAKSKNVVLSYIETRIEGGMGKPM